MNKEVFLKAYYEAIENSFMNDISELVQNWHKKLAPHMATIFDISEKEAFILMEKEYFWYGEVSIKFTRDFDEFIYD